MMVTTNFLLLFFPHSFCSSLANKCHWKHKMRSESSKQAKIGTVSKFKDLNKKNRNIN